MRGTDNNPYSVRESEPELVLISGLRYSVHSKLDRVDPPASVRHPTDLVRTSLCAASAVRRAVPHPACSSLGTANRRVLCCWLDAWLQALFPIDFDHRAMRSTAVLDLSGPS